MEFYAAAEGNVPSGDIEMFNRMVQVIKQMPDLIFDPTQRSWSKSKNQITCHLLCRALAAHYDVTVHDGHFYNHFQHSWLVPKSGACIIDVYPVAGVVPFIVAADPRSPWVMLYKDSDEMQERFIKLEFLESVELTTQAVANTLRKLNFKTPSG